MMDFLTFFLVILFLATFYIILIKDLFFIILISSILSMVFVVVYSILKAPDIAMTEMVSGFGAMSIFSVLSLIYLNRQKTIVKETSLTFSTINVKILATFSLFILLFSVFNIFFEFKMHSSEAVSFLKDFYKKNTHKDFGIESMVTAIIAGYRALDTFLECSVIAVGAFVVRNILKD